MTADERHHPDLERVNAAEGTRWVAHCSCGWYSAEHTTARDAQDDADEHTRCMP